MCKKSFFPISSIVVLALVGIANADPVTQDPGPDGIVCIEAEDFDENVPEGTHTWEFTVAIAGFSGDGYMRAVPDGGGSGNPRLNYEVNFVKTGIHYVWVRGYSTSGTDDSCHAGLDGDETTADRIQAGGGNGPWVWSNNRRENQGRAQVDVTSAGVHIVHVRMREDGWRFDKIVLTTNPDYTPMDLGPDPSWRGPRVRAYNPLPEDGAEYLDTWVNLSWSTGETAVTHDVYFGTNFDDVNDGTGDTFQGNQPDDFLIVGFPGFAFPEGLPDGVTYYWRVDEVEADGATKHKGFVWSFTIPPRKAYEPFPADGARYVLPDDTTLSWTMGLNAKLHTVYFSENFDDVNGAAAAIPRGTTDYSPGSLAPDTVYYWRVDEFDGLGTHKGDVWSFRTLPEILVTDPSLVGWWKLDEDGGAVAIDWSGHGNHGTLQGDPQWAPGQVGGALEFDGSGDYVDCGNPESLTITDNITIMGWIKVAAFTKTWETILAKGDDSYRMSRGPGDGDSIHFAASGTGTNLDATIVVTTDTWRHVAGVYDGTNKIIYIDGAEDARLASAGSIDTSSYNLFIGANSQQAGRNLTGLIDDVRVYNRVLTLDEIKQAMRGELDLAWDPTPTNGSVPPIKEATPLTWSPGDKASEHDVYLGLDKDAVMDADASDVTGVYRGRQGGTTYTPSEGVEWGGGPYYWRVDQVNTDGTISTGRVWSFTVSDFILVEDLESYTDDDAANQAIWQHWIDGFGVPTNGSQVGYVMPPYAEQ
ncbi:MAG: LamG-like jellyroll fold domain-containing protein, partial [Planctomycetota bacterium]